MNRYQLRDLILCDLRARGMDATAAETAPPHRVPAIRLPSPGGDLLVLVGQVGLFDPQPPETPPADQDQGRPCAAAEERQLDEENDW